MNDVMSLVTSLGPLGIALYLLITTLLDNRERRRELANRSVTLDNTFQKVVDFHDKSVVALDAIAKGFAEITAKFSSSIDGLTQTNAEQMKLLKGMMADLEDPDMILKRFTPLLKSQEPQMQAFLSAITSKIDTSETETVQLIQRDLDKAASDLKVAVGGTRTDILAALATFIADFSRLSSRVDLLRAEIIASKLPPPPPVEIKTP